MKKIILTYVFLIFCLPVFSQVNYEKGYIIDNQDNKTNCLIKNLDWRNNPDKIRYILNEGGPECVVGIEEIKEFAVDGKLKFIRETVELDISSNNLQELSTNSNPVWSEEELMLKVIVEGKATLYRYENGNHERFFYKTNGEIKQLVYKRYFYENKGRYIRENSRFRQQLIDDLPCKEYPKDKMKRVNYTLKSLAAYFYTYNGVDVVSVNQGGLAKGQKRMNFRIKPGMAYSSLAIKNSRFDGVRDFTFDSELNLDLKLELEYILPYNRNKWALVLEPEFHKLEMQKDKFISRIISDQNIGASIDYSYVDFPFGVRYNLYLKENNRFFIGLLFIPSFVFDKTSKIDFIDPNFEDLEISHPHSFAIECGFVKDKWSLELNYNLKRNLIHEFTGWQANLNVFSINVGYQFS
ncbi:hypothetical protein [Marinifilum flexuosum]|uniref:hypothetical protein n=1 Tax=Marinifilum flexuosum TaxID=1117708 RepID=UPI002494A543|nr:hypothetical protein [Marinifilum flexuosum]